MDAALFKPRGISSAKFGYGMIQIGPIAMPEAKKIGAHTMKRILYLLIGGALLSGVAAYAAMARTEQAALDGKGKAAQSTRY